MQTEPSVGHMDDLGGDPISEHRPGVGRYIVPLGLIGIGGGMSLVLFLPYLLERDYFYACLTGGVPLLILLAGIIQTIRVGPVMGLRVLVYPKGVAEVKGRKTHIIRWEEIDAVWADITLFLLYGLAPMGMSHSYTVQLTNGKKHRWLWIKDGDRLGKALHDATTPRLYELAKQRLAQGETLRFGRLSINHRGIKVGLRSRAWSDIYDIAVEKGMLLIRRTGNFRTWASLRGSRIPNLPVATALANELIRSYGVQHIDIESRLS